MFLLICLLLGATGLGLSLLIFRSWLSPLGLYSLAWSALVTLHHVVSVSNPGLYFDLDDQTELVVVLAWIAWIAGCLFGRISKRSQGNAEPADHRVDTRKLRLILIGFGFASAICVAASLLKLSRAGVLLQPGDAWRETHFMSTKDLFARGLIYNLAIMVSQGAIYAGTSLGIYAVVRHRFPIWFAVLPAFFGLAYDITIAGRFWITQAPVLTVVAVFLATRHRLGAPAPAGPRAKGRPVAPSAAPAKTRGFFASTKTVIVVAVVTLAGLLAIAQLRSGVKRMNDRGLNVGDVEMTNVLVGPVLYATDTLGLLNVYTSSQHNWGSTRGRLFMGGVVYLANIPANRLLKSDFGSEVWSYTVESDELLPIGYQRNGQFFTSYLVPATADFGFLGIFIYPLLAGFLFTKIYQSAVGGGSLLTMALYPLVAIWVVFTVMRWELIGATPWIAAAYLFIADRWVIQRRSR
jgi:hypothetical protein